MPEPLKNMYNERFFEALMDAVQSVYPAFDRSAFLNGIYDSRWEIRELKERMRHITMTLRAALPNDYRAALDILRRAAPALRYGFETMIFPDFVEVYGLGDWDASIPALEQFTQQSSAEFAVRPFILQDQDRMMAQMSRWARHEHAHVRRLASEGCRPRLPWAVGLPSLKNDPSPILPILEHLKLDESEFVRRSVANNLNDISKDHPQVVLEMLRHWRAHDTKTMRELLSHALRTLIKRGDGKALALLGYAAASTEVFAVTNMMVDPAVVLMGGEMTFSFVIESRSETAHNLMIDYIVHHQRAKGQLTPKVFKLTKKLLTPGATVTITKKHSFKPITTRRYYPGKHAIEIQINGMASARSEFTLTEA